MALKPRPAIAKNYESITDREVIFGTLKYDYHFDEPFPGFDPNDPQSQEKLDVWRSRVMGGRDFYIEPYAQDICADYTPRGRRKITSYFNPMRLFNSKAKNPAPKRPEPVLLEKGDLLAIFETVSAGQVIWNGVIKQERKPETSDYSSTMHQAGMSAEAWHTMFKQRLPAMVKTKDGRIIYGGLEPFQDQGMDGIAFAVTDYTKQGYDALHILENGDKLTVFGEVTDGDIPYSAFLDFADTDPSNEERGGYGRSVRALLTWDEKTTDRFFYGQMPVRVIRKKTRSPE